MTFARLVSIGVMLPAALAAQAAAPDTAVLARIRDEGFNRSKVFETAIAISDIRGPRLAGSPQYREAAEWIVKEATSWGLTNAMLEPWGTRGGRSWSVTRHSVELVAPYYARLVAYPKAWSPSTRGVVRGTPVVATVRSEEDVARQAAELRGKIVLLGPVGVDSARWTPIGERFTGAQLDSMARAAELAATQGPAGSAARSARAAAAMSSGASPWRAGATRSWKMRGELTIAARSGCDSGTLMTSMRNCAVFGLSVMLPWLHPGNSSAERTPADPET